MSSVRYTSHQEPVVGNDGLVPLEILGRLDSATGAGGAQHAAAEKVRAFLIDVCADLADHRRYSMENRAELDVLRWIVHGARIERAGQAMEHADRNGRMTA